jgi:hypothetical protein
MKKKQTISTKRYEKRKNLPWVVKKRYIIEILVDPTNPEWHENKYRSVLNKIQSEKRNLNTPKTSFRNFGYSVTIVKEL